MGDLSFRESRLGLSRRDFGTLSAAGLGGLAALSMPRLASASSDTPPDSGADAVQRWSLGPAQPVSLVGVAKGSDDRAVALAVRRAALSATDFSWLSRGDSVLIKPVCNSGSVYPATTDPVALRTMIALLREQGAARIIVADMSGVQVLRFGPDRTSGSTRELMIQNTMARTTLDAGAELQAFEEAGWDAFHDEEPASSRHWLEPVMMPNVVNEVDHIILMPRCGRHMLAGSTLGLKAAVGWWRHDSRLAYHKAGATLPQATAEANTIPTLTEKQRLVLTSATRVMTTFGPDQGSVAEPETGLVLASSSVVAHDMVSLSWLLENRSHTPAAKRDGITNDPHTSGFVRGVANRVVTTWLGGIGDALATSTPPKSDTTSIWDDRVLAGAFEAFGGVPQVELVDEEGSLPATLLASLAESVAV